MNKKLVVLAPDSFKDSISARNLCSYMESAINNKYSDIKIISLPMADGGEGTVEALKYSFKYVNNIPVSSKKIKVTSPKKDKKVNTEYIVLQYENKKTAVIEMASASGLPLVKEDQRNPFNTTSYGTGELIKHAITTSKCKRIILSIGGSATNDGGAGMLQALGIKFYNKNGNLLKAKITNKSLDKIFSLSVNNFYNLIKDIDFFILCDVNNPLLGKNGATFVFSEQKFSKKIQNNQSLLKKYQNKMEANLKHFYDIAESPKSYKENLLNIFTIRNEEGSGAAGGLGAACKLFFNGRLSSGIEKIMELVKFKENIEKADLVITGEGRIDNQTLSGKTISGIIHVAKDNKVKVIAITGSIKENTDLKKLKDNGLAEIFSICNSQISYAMSMKEPEKIFNKRFTEIIMEEKFVNILNK